LSAVHEVTLRAATPDDASVVAELHADSWRRHYRGAYADAYLDGDVAAERWRVWSERLTAAAGASTTIVAERAGDLVGFAHVIFDHQPEWGALLDNLHVRWDVKRAGLGTVLMAQVARAVLDRPAPTGLYLWVLEQNAAAQAFYDSRGGRRRERALTEPPGGDPNRLNGDPAKLRYWWPDPSPLLLDNR